MRFSVGCLVGAVIGLFVAAVGFLGFFFIGTGGEIPLSPVTTQTGAADITVLVQESYIVSQMQQYLTELNVPMSQPSFKVHAPNRAVASGTVSVTILGAAISVHPNVTLHFSVDSGQLHFFIDQIEVSGFTVPKQLVDQEIQNYNKVAEEKVNADIKKYLGTTGLRLVGIEATEGVLIVKLSH